MFTLGTDLCQQDLSDAPSSKGHKLKVAHHPEPSSASSHSSNSSSRDHHLECSRPLSSHSSASERRSSSNSRGDDEMGAHHQAKEGDHRKSGAFSPHVVVTPSPRRKSDPTDHHRREKVRPPSISLGEEGDSRRHGNYDRDSSLTKASTSSSTTTPAAASATREDNKPAGAIS